MAENYNNQFNMQAANLDTGESTLVWNVHNITINLKVSKSATSSAYNSAIKARQQYEHFDDYLILAQSEANLMPEWHIRSDSSEDFITDKLYESASATRNLDLGRLSLLATMSDVVHYPYGQAVQKLKKPSLIKTIKVDDQEITVFRRRPLKEHLGNGKITGLLTSLHTLASEPELKGFFAWDLQEGDFSMAYLQTSIDLDDLRRAVLDLSLRLRKERRSLPTGSLYDLIKDLNALRKSKHFKNL